MEISLRKAYAEVDSILNLMENKYVDSIPPKLRELFKSQKDVEYSPKIDVKKPLEQQKLQPKTFAILAVLNLNYWCENEETKKELLQKYAENDIKKENKLREMYSINKIFDDTTEKAVDDLKNEPDNIKLPIIKEKNILKKIVNKIKNLFKNN